MSSYSMYRRPPRREKFKVGVLSRDKVLSSPAPCYRTSIYELVAVLTDKIANTCTGNKHDWS